MRNSVFRRRNTQTYTNERYKRCEETLCVFISFPSALVLSVLTDLRDRCTFISFFCVCDAQVTPSEMCGVAHHCISILDPATATPSDSDEDGGVSAGSFHRVATHGTHADACSINDEAVHVGHHPRITSHRHTHTHIHAIVISDS